MKTNRLLTIATMLILLLTGSTFAANLGDTIPDFKLNTFDGKAFGTNEIKGNNPMMLIFWATWCPSCTEEIPRLKSTYSEFTSKGLKMLAINVAVNDSEPKAREYVDKHSVPYPVAFDTGSTVTKSLRIFGTPTVIIVDQEGVIRYRGYTIPDNLGDEFDKLFN